jgi:hypothetical protein
MSSKAFKYALYFVSISTDLSISIIGIGSFKYDLIPALVLSELLIRACKKAFSGNLVFNSGTIQFSINCLNESTSIIEFILNSFVGIFIGVPVASYILIPYFSI